MVQITEFDFRNTVFFLMTVDNELSIILERKWHFEHIFLILADTFNLQFNLF